MQIKIFTIPVVADERDVEELNLFLRSHKVIDVKREITQYNGNSCWTFCITYMPDNHTVSPRERVLHHAIMNVCHDFFDLRTVLSGGCPMKGRL